MSDEQGYNGWKNYETWAVALWIDNEQGSHEWAVGVAREIIGDENIGEQYRAVDIGQVIRAELDDAMPDLGASVWADLLNAAFSEIDWREIGEHYLSTLEDVDA